MKNRYALFINSLLILVAADIFGTIIHEGGHFVAAQFFGLHPELHHNYVRYADESVEPQTRMLIAAAGPLVSLVLGLVFLWIFYRMPISLGKLAAFWTGLGGLLGFLGYLLIAPFISEGDTGRVFAYFGIPFWLAVVIAVASFVVINLVFKAHGKFLTDFSSHEAQQKNSGLAQLVIWPTFSIMVVMSLLQFPIVTWVSLLPTVCMPMTNFSLIGGYKKALPTAASPLLVEKISWTWLALAVGLVALFRWLV